MADNDSPRPLRTGAPLPITPPPQNRSRWAFAAVWLLGCGSPAGSPNNGESAGGTATLAAGAGGAAGGSYAGAGAANSSAGDAPGGAINQAGTSGATASAGSGGSAGTDAGGSAGADAGGSAGAGPLVVGFDSMWSGTVVATPSQQLAATSGANTYRTYVRPRAAGLHHWAFWVSNGIDGTWGTGEPRPNQLGGRWTIDAAYVADGGANPTGAVLTGTSVRVTFDGQASKKVEPGDRFWSDPVALDLPEGHQLVFTWTLSGTSYPLVNVPFLTSYKAGAKSIAAQETTTGFEEVKNVVAPGLFAYDRPVTERLCFLGDSITQGIGSALDTYGFWVAKLGAKLSPDIGIWNLGNGWARAADAASDGYWLYKAKQCSEVAIVLGVNDLGSSARNSAQVLADLTKIIDRVKANNASAKVILFTVPTFGFTGSRLEDWRTINAAIKTKPPTGVNRVFDVAAVLSKPPPADNELKDAYHNGSNMHPNDAGSSAIAAAFLSWFEK